MTDPLSEKLSAAVAAPVAAPGDQFGHYCATHIYDEQCVANPAACRAFCGYDFDPSDTAFSAIDPACIVCDSMCEARGDFDLNQPDED